MIASFKQLDGLAKLAPGFQAMHPMEPAAATEVVSLHMHEMTSMQVETQAHIPAYAAWMDAQDLRGVYRYEETALKVLQHGYDSTRWSLKTPAYLAGLDAVFDVYPNARMVWTHRDPADVVVSVSSLNAALHQVMTKDVDPVVVGPPLAGAPRRDGRPGHGLPGRAPRRPDHPPALRRADRRTRSARSSGSTPTSASSWTTRPRPPSTAATQHHRQDKHGRHRYRAEDFDLDPDDDPRALRRLLREVRHVTDRRRVRPGADGQSFLPRGRFDMEVRLR